MGEGAARTADRRLAWAWLALVALAALGAPWIAPFDPAAQPDVAGGRGLAPTATHWFGTDTYSRDVLSRLLHGARVSLGLGGLAGLLSAGIGAGVGAFAAGGGRWRDAITMRVVDAGLALPRVVLLAAIAAAWGALPAPLLVVVLAGTGWFATARLVRAELRAAQGAEWLLAARALGASPWRLWWRHLLPAAWPTARVAATLAIAQAIALESALSFLGIGVPPPTASWGAMLGEARDAPWRWWWLLAAPGLALSATVLAWHVVADAWHESPADARESGA